MKIHLAFGMPVILLMSVYAAEKKGWESLIFNFFRVRSTLSINAYVCKRTDGLLLFRNIANLSGKIHRPISLNVVHVHDFQLQLNVDMRTGLFIDVSCAENRKLLFQIADFPLFTNNFCWLIWDPIRPLIASYEALPLSTFSDVSIANHEKVTRLHKHKHDLPMVFRDVGFRTSGSNEFVFVPWNVRIDYMKTVVNGAIMFIDDIYDRNKLQQQLQDDQYRPGNDVSNRFIYGNTLHLAYLFNFTYVHVPYCSCMERDSLNLTETQNWGDRASNGTWNGLIGLLQRQEADLTISPLLPISQRLEVSYPSVPILPYWMAAIVKQPRALGTYRAMLMELSSNTWICVALVIVSGSVVFALTQKLEYQDLSLHITDGSVSMGFLQSVGIICNQGLNLIPYGTPGRIACITLLLVGLLIYNHYSAATMTALLSPSPPFIKSLEQLMSSTVPISAVDAPYVRFGKSRTRVFRKIVVERLEKDMKVCSITEGIMDVMNGSAFLGEYFVLFRAVTENLQSDVACDLTVFNAGFHQNAASFTKKCSHFRELYTRGMLRTFEHGLMPKERLRWIAGEPVCSRKTEFIHVRLESVSVAAGIFAVGFICAQILFLLEILIDKRRIRSNALKRRMLSHTKRHFA